VAVVAAVVVAVWLARRPQQNRPNLIFIMVDTLRADYLGSYGFTGDLSPNLDRLATESVLFERCSSQAPWTKPAIATLFTGLHPQTHRVLTHDGLYGDGRAAVHAGTVHTDALPAAAHTLAEALHKAGYETAGFIANPWVGRALGFAQGFDVYDEHLTGNAIPAEPILAAASTWLDARAGRQPFFLYLHLMEPHGPYNAPDEDFAALRNSPSLGGNRRLLPRELRAISPNMRSLPWVRSPDSAWLRTWRGRYAAGVRFLDRQLAPFLSQLRDAGTLDRSVLVFTSDHGEQLCEHSDWEHGDSLHEHQLHVPLFIRMPDAAGGGARVADQVSLIDLMPTLLSITGVSPPPRLQGRDLSGLLLGKAAPDASSTTLAAGVKWQPDLRSLRSGPHKLIVDLATGEAQLYDLDTDPTEQRNLADTRPELLDQLKAELASRLREVAATPSLTPESVEVGDELRQQLEALGYLEGPTPTAAAPPAE
jgi:arylsulfatase A-like enzyme